MLKRQTKILDTTSEQKSAEITNIRSNKHCKKMVKKYKTPLSGRERNLAKTKNYIHSCNYCGNFCHNNYMNEFYIIT